jgi:hypothetical protein
MFADSVIQSSGLLLLAGLGMALFWTALGRAQDARIFLALNFSLITVWAFISDSSVLLRCSSLLFIFLIVFCYRFPPPRALALRLDNALDVDMSLLLILISCFTIYLNLDSGLTKVEDKAILLLQTTDDPNFRYTGYLLGTGAWMIVHMICATASQPRWTLRQKVALAATILASATSLSKASFLPILLTFLFVYGKRIGVLRVAVIAFSGLFLTILLIQRLFDDVTLVQVLEIFFNRVINNIDVLNYIDELGPGKAEDYPYASVFYPLWPFYQMTQTEFLVPGVWLHGMLYNDWRGYGPNPTFIGDLLLGSNYAGLLFAPLFGVLLRVANSSRFRVFIVMACYTFLQDWSTGCLNIALFCLVLVLIKAASHGFGFKLRWAQCD